MKTLVPLIFAGAAVALAGCATSESQDGGKLTAGHTIAVKHPLNHSGQSKEKWSLKENRTGAFRLKAKKNQVIEWQKPGEFYIVVLNTNNWDPSPQKWIPLPGFECPTCGAVSATDTVSLTFLPNKQTGTTNSYHYRIVVYPGRSNKMVPCPDPDGCDYDMVDAMITWDGSKIERQQDRKRE